MPELPEVEVICRGLAPHLEGQRLIIVSFGKKKLRIPMPTQRSMASVKGEIISSVKRRAKYIIITLENSAKIIIHLGMTGRLGLFPQGAPSAKHDHATWLLANKMELRFNDTRRFGSVQIVRPDVDHEILFANLGPDPFWDSFSGEYLNKKARNRTIAVKNFIMDNRIVVGIGNIYASEILFATGINPETSAGSINAEEWQEIVLKSREILEDAISQGGSTISDYVNSEGEKGYFQVNFQVYGRTGQSCRRCGELIQKTSIGGRASFYCPGCQPVKE